MYNIDNHAYRYWLQFLLLFIFTFHLLHIHSIGIHTPLAFVPFSLQHCIYPIYKILEYYYCTSASVDL